MKRAWVVMTQSLSDGKMLATWGPLTKEGASAWRKYKATKFKAHVVKIRKPHWNALRKAMRKE